MALGCEAVEQQLKDLTLIDAPVSTICDQESGNGESDKHNDGKCFRLLALPLELVLRVLELVVVQSSKPEPIDVIKATSPKAIDVTRAISLQNFEPGGYPERGRLIQPAITRTCRLLRAEGLTPFYSQNVFAIVPNAGFRAAEQLQRWLRCLTEQQKANITIIYHVLDSFPAKRYAGTDLSILLKQLNELLKDRLPDLKVAVLQHSTKIPRKFRYITDGTPGIAS